MGLCKKKKYFQDWSQEDKSQDPACWSSERKVEWLKCMIKMFIKCDLSVVYFVNKWGKSSELRS